MDWPWIQPRPLQWQALGLLFAVDYMEKF